MLTDLRPPGLHAGLFQFFHHRRVPGIAEEIKYALGHDGSDIELLVAPGAFPGAVEAAPEMLRQFSRRPFAHVKNPEPVNEAPELAVLALSNSGDHICCGSLPHAVQLRKRIDL